jgi:hypothetical protein
MENNSKCDRVKRLIEEKLGYSFKPEELPSQLKVKLIELENELDNLHREEYSYERLKKELENSLEKRLAIISEQYDEKSERLSAR